MGNIGGPSRGCQECRRRKVKCDEAKPECTRCTNAGKKCPGYRDNLSTRFRYASAAGIVDKRKYERKQQQQNSPEASRSSITSKSNVLMKDDQDESIFHVVTILFEVFYTTNASQQQDNLRTSLANCFDTFTAIIKTSEHGSSVRLAMSAVFRGFYSFISRNREMEALAKADFTTAVSLAREALDDPVESKSDVTLLTVFFLSMFENIDCIKEQRSPITTHQIGLVHLLRHRGPEALESGISQFCLRQFYERFAAAVMGADQSIMTELLETALLLPTPSNEFSSSFPVSFVVPIAELRLQIEAVEIYSTFDAGTVKNLLSSASQLDRDLSTWPDQTAPSCHPVKRTPPPILSNDLSKTYPDWTDTYPSLAIAQDWNYYRYLRIVLNIFISRLAALLRQYSLAASADQVCEQMVDGVCASIPFYIGALQRNVELFKHNPNSRQFVMPEVDVDSDREYVSSAVGAMLLMPKLRWILKYYPSLRARQVEWLEMQISDLALFYRMHGVED